MKFWKNYLAMALTGAMLVTALPVQSFAMDELSSGTEESAEAVDYAEVIDESAYYSTEVDASEEWLLDDTEDFSEESYASEEILDDSNGSDEVLDYSDLLDDGETEALLEEELTSGEELDDGSAELVGDTDTVVTGTTNSGIGWSFDTSTGTLIMTPGGEDTLLTRDDLPGDYFQQIKSLKVSDGFTGLHYDACYSIPNLRSVYLADSVTYLGYDAFAYCEKLESVRLPENLSEIGIGAFANCGRLTSVTIPASVNKIGHMAFNDCPALKEIIVLSQDCELDRDYVFGYMMEEEQYNTDLTIYCYTGSTTEAYAQRLGLTYELIGDRLSDTCGENLTWEIMTSQKTLLIRGFGEMENYYTKGPGWAKYILDIDKIVIERGVTSIGAYAFTGIAASSVSIPESVSSIGDYALSSMESLNEITILNRSTAIGERALGFVYAADGSCYPKDGFVIHGYTGSTAETYALENKITFDALDQADVLTGECGGSAYWTYTRATLTLEITGKGSIDDFSLTDENNLPPWLQMVSADEITNVIISDRIERIGAYTFAGLTKVSSISIPKNVFAIYEGAFSGMTSLETVTIPNEWVSIDEKAFENCTSLTSVDLSAATYMELINASTFANCTSLKTVLFPKELLTIGDGAFANCTSLAAADLPETVETIGKQAFYNCTSLSSVNIPENLATIDDYAFDGCTSLKKVEFNGVIRMDLGAGVFKNCTSLAEADLSNVWSSIGDEMFMDCSSLKKLSLSERISFIGDSAFEGCTSLTDLAIPEFTIEIGSRAYFNCPGIKTVTIPVRGDTIEIGSNAFGYLYSNASYGYGKVENFTLRGYSRCTDVKTYAERNGFNYEVIDYPRSGSAGDHAAWSYDEETKTLTIQGTGAIKDWTTEYIADSYYTRLPADWYGWVPEVENIVVGEGITSIGICSFLGMTNVKNIQLPETLLTVKTGSFSQMDTIDEIRFPRSITEIHPFAFWNTTVNKIYGYTGTGLDTYLRTFANPPAFIDLGRMEDLEAETIRISSTQIGDGYVSITWSASSNAETYRIYRREGRETTLLVKTVQSDVTHYRDTNVEVGKTYTYMAVGAYDTARSNKVSKAVVYKAVPQVQAKLQAASVLVSWEADSNADGYRLYRTDGNNSLTRVYLKSGVTSYTDTKVTSGSTYTYTIQAYNGRDVVVYKAKSLAYIAEPTVTLENAATGVNVKWSQVDGAGGYYIYRKSGTGSYQRIATQEASKTSYIDTTAASGTTYTYAVRAYIGSQQSTFTGKSILYLKTPTVTLTNVTTGVQVKWPSITGNKGYYIYRKTGTGKYTRIATAAAGSRAYTDKTVLNGITYTYAVRAYNGTTLSGFVGTTVRYLAAPTVTATRLTGRTSVLLSWNRITGSSGYYIYRKSGSGSYTRIAVVSGNTKITYTDANASRTVKYTYAVRAYYGTYLSAFIPVTES